MSIDSTLFVKYSIIIIYNVNSSYNRLLTMSIFNLAIILKTYIYYLIQILIFNYITNKTTVIY